MTGCPHGAPYRTECIACFNDAVRAERERVLRIIEAEIETLPMNVYCASKLDLLIQRIRKGDP
ncbi:MAG TPA: hypothetical protein VIE65_00725 [Methylobacter sp.]|jgi:hypothetical protein